MLATSSNGQYVAGQLAGLVVIGLGYWGWFGRKRRVGLVYVAGVVIGLSAIPAWLSQFHVAVRTPSLSYANINPIVNVAAGIIVLCVMRFRPVWSTLLIVYVFNELLQAFAFLYWNYGARGNFNTPLTHLDSLYVAVGTLTTAGTANSYWLAH